MVRCMLTLRGDKIRVRSVPEGLRRPGTVILEAFHNGSFEITGSHSRVGAMETFFFFGVAN